MVAAAAVGPPLALNLCLDGGSGGRGSDATSDGSGGGGGGGGSSHEVFAVAADASEEEDEEDDVDDDEAEHGGEDEEEEPDDEDDEPLAEVGVDGSFNCGEIRAEGLPVGEGIPSEEDLFASLNCQRGFSCTRTELSEDIKQLYQTGLFESVNARVLPQKKGRFKVVFDFVEKRYPEIQTFNVEGAQVLPKTIVKQVQEKLAEYKGQPFTMQTMAVIKNMVEGWYTSRGFGLSYISHFTGMPTGDVVAHVVEGKTAKVSVVHVDEEGNPSKTSGKISSSFILKHCPVEIGTLYNMNEGRKTLQNVFALDLFDNVQILPRQNEKDPSRVDVEVMVREKPMQTADLEAEWGIAAPGDNGKPGIVSLVPGGTISYENRNLLGNAASIAASVNTKNFLSPADDLSFRMQYSQPYMYGLDDPKRTRLTASLFNGRKICGVFTPGTGGEEVPSVWVDRTGVKIGATEQYSHNSKGTLALVAQEITSRDETGAPCTRGMRTTPFGQYVADGPPTGLSDKGVDRVLSAQAALTRDTTYLVNGAQVGARDVVTVEQGLGIGSGAPLFNRMEAQCTRFWQLTAPRGKGAPVTLVAHSRVGNAIGDLPAYNAFLLGGPFSVRGYNVGELAACRRYAEAATELRVPLFGQQLFAFAEYGSDLGSSGELRGNPTLYYRRAGSGGSYGAGGQGGGRSAARRSGTTTLAAGTPTSRTGSASE